VRVERFPERFVFEPLHRLTIARPRRRPGSAHPEVAPLASSTGGPEVRFSPLEAGLRLTALRAALQTFKGAPMVVRPTKVDKTRPAGVAESMICGVSSRQRSAAGIRERERPTLPDLFVPYPQRTDI
jgi:hypothetical protein